jgi:outer membrane biosynthesis protein TonB
MNSRLMLLTAAALALGALAYHQYKDYLPGLGGSGGPRAPAPAAIATGGAKPVELNPFAGLDPKSYASILERPLFNPGRQPRPPEPPPEEKLTPEPPPPPEPPPEPPPAGPNAGDYRLLGVSAGPDGRLAAVEVAATSEVIYVREGDAAGEWTVLEVGDRSVTIGSSENAVTLNLFENTEEPASGQDQPAEDDQSGEQNTPTDSPIPMMPGQAPPEAQPDPAGQSIN